MSRRRCGPGTNGGRGFAICDASGFLAPANDRVSDLRQGLVRKDMADYSGPSFGTYHPLDLFDVGIIDDPKPIENARAPDLQTEMDTAVEGLPEIEWPGLEGAPDK